ncbi:MAG: response regulator [Boseongicola sp.]|nr:response regulator [Boseongicola sp.]
MDDSPTARNIIRKALSAHPSVNVVGEAANATQATRLIKELSPDVLTLDVEMPGVNGLDFLNRLMRTRPMPVIMVSSKLKDYSRAKSQALAHGAIECFDFLKLIREGSLQVDLVEAIIRAAVCKRQNQNSIDFRKYQPSSDSLYEWNGRYVVIGSSAGGVDALRHIVAALPMNCPPVIVAQHMPADFLRRLAERLDAVGPAKVILAKDRSPIRPGQVLVAPGGDFHARLQGLMAPHLRLDRADKRDLHRPSIDALFSSCMHLGPRCVAVILSGMGHDGARSMLNLRKSGATTLVQSSRTSVIDGMPSAARELQAYCETPDLEHVAGRILHHPNRHPAGSARA